MAELVRSFVALRFSKEVHQRLESLKRSLKKAIDPVAKVKWVASDAIHLTLQFLGDVKPTVLTALGADLKATLLERQRFQVELKGVSAFPSPSRPRIIWVGMTVGDTATIELATQVMQTTSGFGFTQEDRPFRPHTTLGRVKSLDKGQDLSRIFERFSLEPVGKCQIDEVVLVASKLTPQGPIYRDLDRLALRG